MAADNIMLSKLELEQQEPTNGTASLQNNDTQHESRGENSSEDDQSTSNANGQQKSKHRKLSKEKQLICNVSDTKYPVVRLVTKKLMGWKLQRSSEALNWDIMWTDNAVQPQQLSKMQPHQKINHFPGMYSLSRKNYLGRNLMRMRKGFPDEYNFFPLTWMLPSEYGQLRAYFEKDKKPKTVIVKPQASCQGRGIFLTRNFEGNDVGKVDIQHGEHYVVQKYITKPLLVDSLKFDFRIYVLLAGCSPLRIYLYNQGLARFATQKYTPPNKDNIDTVCMHLTNYAINKTNTNFVYNESDEQMDTGHKRSLTSVFKTLKERGFDTDGLWTKIKDMIVKTFISAQPVLSHHYKSCQPDNYANNMCFQVLGLDVMLDESFKPYLLEVNYTPSFSTDTPLDKLIKKNVIKDSLVLMNITHRTKTEVISTNKEVMMKRMLTGKKDRVSQQEKVQLVKKAQEKRDEWEDRHLGGYERIYPPKKPHPVYDEMLDYSQNCYEELTGTNVKRNTKKELSTQLSGHLKKDTRNEQLQKIYKAKPPPNPFLSKAPTAVGQPRRTNKSCVRMANIDMEQQHTQQLQPLKQKPPTTEAYSTLRQTQPRKLPSSQRHIQPIFKMLEKRDYGNYLRPKLFEINPNFTSAKEF